MINKQIRMKTTVFALGAAAMIALASCGDASSKIKNNNDVAKEGPAPVATPAADPSIVDTDGAPVFAFDKERHDFGQINQGDKPTTTFEFTNTGDAPLIISNAKGSCGCTVPEWPKEPIAPGEKGSIQVEFDSNGKSGVQTKTVTLTANTVPNTKVLTITSNIVVPES